ncbi:MAG: hypothetical protein AAB074_19685 [Planctomycetota bacterium]
MDAPIAPAALRQAADGPAYDLISLGLVVFTTLLITVWTTHFFRQQPADVKDLPSVEDRAEHVPGSVLLTSAGHLQVAQWADFNLRSAGGNGISMSFTVHLSAALELEVQERENLSLLAESANISEIDRVSARMQLKQKPLAREYAKKWYELRRDWIEANDRRGFDIGTHFEFQNVLVQFGMLEEAVGGQQVSAKFRQQLKEALAVEDWKRAGLQRLLKEGTKEEQEKARVELGKHPPDGPVRTFAKAWYEIRAKWLRTRSGVPYDESARREFVSILREIGLQDEAKRETVGGSQSPGGTEPE